MARLKEPTKPSVSVDGAVQRITPYVLYVMPHLSPLGVDV